MTQAILPFGRHVIDRVHVDDAILPSTSWVLVTPKSGRSKMCRLRPSALTLAHDDIRGFMPAMEMMYKVRAPEVSQGLRPGDTVDFAIDAAKSDIVEVKLVAHAQ